MVSLPAPWPRTDAFLESRTLSVRHAPSTNPGAPGAVFIHGLGGSSLNWTDLMAALQPDVDGYAIDLGGFGESPPPRDGDMTPAGHAAGIVEFIVEELGGEPVHVFGNSLGGSVALQLAARRPDLARSLTLISPALPSVFATRSNAHLPVIAMPGVGERLIEKYLTLPAEQRVRATIDTCFGDPSRSPSQRTDEAREEAESRDHLPYVADAFLGSLRGLLRTYVDLGPQRPWKLASRVQCPTLVVYGGQDPLVGSGAAHRVTKHFRHAHVVVLPESGHVAQMEHPDLVYEAWVRFCRS